MEQLVRQQVERLLRRKRRRTSVPLLPTTRLAEDIGLDSIQTVELVIDLEHRFHIQIPDPELEALRTVQHVLDCVEHHLAVPVAVA